MRPDAATALGDLHCTATYGVNDADLDALATAGNVRGEGRLEISGGCASVHRGIFKCGHDHSWGRMGAEEDSSQRQTLITKFAEN